MRDAFISELFAHAELDDRTFLVVGDLGFSVIERFQERFPAQFLNSGVAEQAMMSVAAGLAAGGYNVFTYSIANFPTMRCIEQIRNDVCYHNRAVTVVSVGAGYSYGNLGYTHHAVEDIAVMRALPGMTILSPADPIEAEGLTRWAATNGGPKYLRLGKNGEPRLHPEGTTVQYGKMLQVREGTDVTVLGTGSIVAEAVRAHDLLAERRISAAVHSVPFVKPLDDETLIAAAETAGIVTVEEHSAVGGLGAAVLQRLSELGLTVPVRMVATPDARLTFAIGSQSYLRQQAGLTAEHIADEAASLLRAHQQAPALVRS